MRVCRIQGFRERFLNPKAMKAKLFFSSCIGSRTLCRVGPAWMQTCGVRSADAAGSCSCISGTLQNTHKASIHWLFCYHLPITTSMRNRPFQMPGFDKTAYDSVTSRAHLSYKTHICHYLAMGFLQHLFLLDFPRCPWRRSCLPALCLCPLPLSSQPCPRCLPRRGGYGRGGSGKGRDPRTRALLSPHSRAPPGIGAPGPAPPRALRRRSPARVEAGAGRAKSGGR